MALPPQILRIKRKRDEDPVDSLYIENADIDSKTKRRVTEHDFVFKRLIDEEIGQNLRPKAPEPRLPRSQLNSGIPKTVSSAVLEQNVKILQQKSSEGMSEPRRFHLSQISAAIAASEFASKGSKKRRRDHDSNIAIFEEEQRQQKLNKLMERGAGEHGLANISSGNKDSLVTQSLVLPARKRPGATAVISKSASSASLRRMELEDAKAVQAREALQRYALEELGSVVQEDKTTSGSSQRRTMRSTQDADEMEVETSDSEYIYDTYVRHTNSDPSGKVPIPSRDEKLQTLVGDSTRSPNAIGNSLGTFGFVVLPPRPSSAPGSSEAVSDPHSNPFWATFGDNGNGELVNDDSSEEADWDTEQDDENAENFYGADYPEDELDSDDEGGDQAAGYARFRRAKAGVSDDEDDFRYINDEGLEDDYDALDVHDSWNTKHRGRVWRMGGTSHRPDSDEEGADADDEDEDMM